MAQRTVLCVEPDEGSVSTIRRALEPYGFEVTDISNGEQAVDWAKKNRPTLIVVSVEPRKVGYAVCNKIKRSDDLKGIPLILTSSEETPQTFEQHRKLKSRADEYLLKPFAPEDLVAKVSLVMPLGDVQVNSDEIILTNDLDEISIADSDIVEDAAPNPFAEGAKTGTAELDAIFDQETDAAFAALQAGGDGTGPIPLTGGASDPPTGGEPSSPWDLDAAQWEAEATRATSITELEAEPPPDGGDAGIVFPFDAPVPASGPIVASPEAHAADAVLGAFGDAATVTFDRDRVDTVKPENGVASEALADVQPADVQAALDDVEVPVPDAVVPFADEVVSPVMHDTVDADGPASPSPVVVVATPVDDGRVKDLERRIEGLETERTRLLGEVDELRARVAAPSLAKDKEVLTLREIINRKEKDILDLRDGLDAKERQILDHKDRIREHERARRDLEEKSLGIEKTLMSANERVAALMHDKDKAQERERGLKARLDDAHAEISKAHDEVDSLKKKAVASEERFRSELDRTRGELETRIVEMEEMHRSEVTRLADERAAAETAMHEAHEAELERMRTTHAGELEAERRKASEELAATNDRWSTETSKLRRDHEKAIASLKEENAVQMAAERQAHQAASEAKERDHKNEILGMRRRHEEESRAADERRQRELADAEARRLADLDAAENRRRADLQARDEEHGTQIAEMDRRHFTEKTETAERHRAELDAAHVRAARAEGDLAARTEELSAAHRRIAGLEADLDAARADLRDREVKLAQATARIGELEGKTAEYEEQIMRAFQKIRNDDKAIDKAKRALAVALSLLDERSAPAAGATTQSSPGLAAVSAKPAEGSAG